jgi:hypothetical protein
MSHRPGVLRCVLVICLLLLIAATVVGCSSASSGTDETTAGSSTTLAVSPSSSDSSTTSPPVTLNQFDKELADTANVENKLAQYLSAQEMADNDPRLAIIYGLRARVQALSCRKALDSKDTTVADSAMLDVYSTINLGRKVATGSVATTLEAAYATIKTLGHPSDAPEKATQLLDTFINQLKPLIDDAKAITAATTSTAS